jgi:subtilase family serine protease
MKQTLRKPRRTLGVLLIGATAAAVAVVLTAAGAASAGGKAGISQGLGAAALTTTPPFGDTPADTPETVSFILNARDLGGLEGKVQAGMPGGFLSVDKFAQQYGQPAKNISALENYLSQYDITSHAMTNGLDVQATGTAGDFDAALAVQQKQFHVNPPPAVPGGPPGPPMTVHGTTQTPLLPKNLASFVLAVLGLSNYPTQQSNMAPVPAAAQPKSGPNTALFPSDFAARYNLSGVNGNGSGRRIGIVTLASENPAVISQFWQQAGLAGAQASASRITLDNVDGGSGPVSERAGSDETTLDTEQSGGLAPGANITVYQAPNTDNGFVDGFFQAASDNTADSVSASWGESEAVIAFLRDSGLQDPNYIQTFDEAFLELAAQGQSTFVSSGDAGAYDDSDELGTTELVVDNPGDSPWVTSSGGTTLPGTLNFTSIPSTTIPAERAWGWDWLWPLLVQGRGNTEAFWAKNEAAGDGGGYSWDEPMPAYQHGVKGTNEFNAVPYFTPISPVEVAPGLTLPTDWSFNGSPATIHGHGDGRVVPDLSTDADPETGYLVWYTFGDSTNPNVAPSYEQFGGTSFVAPQLNGSTAAIDSALGHRVGFWNPAIYQFAKMKSSPFTPLNTPGTTNDNLYYSGKPGTLYNPATGLGTPDLAKLASDFAKPGPPGPGH